MAAIITKQMMGEGQGWAKEGTTGAAGAQGMTHLEPAFILGMEMVCGGGGQLSSSR